MMGLKDLTPLRGQLLPTKTVQETQSEEITGETSCSLCPSFLPALLLTRFFLGKAYVVEIGIKSASSVLKYVSRLDKVNCF